MKTANVGTIVFELALLAAIVALVDDTLLRVGLAVLPGMLLAQQATRGSSTGADAWSGNQDRRTDQEAREHVNRLLQRLREFHTTCHLMRSNQISADAAIERAAAIEQDLNRILADLTQAARAGPAASARAP